MMNKNITPLTYTYLVLWTSLLGWILLTLIVDVLGFKVFFIFPIIALSIHGLRLLIIFKTQKMKTKLSLGKVERRHPSHPVIKKYATSNIKEITDHITMTKNTKILDIGCGNGYYLSLIHI